MSAQRVSESYVLSRLHVGVKTSLESTDHLGTQTLGSGAGWRRRATQQGLELTWFRDQPKGSSAGAAQEGNRVSHPSFRAQRSISQSLPFFVPGVAAAGFWPSAAKSDSVRISAHRDNAIRAHRESSVASPTLAERVARMSRSSAACGHSPATSRLLPAIGGGT